MVNFLHIVKNKGDLMSTIKSFSVNNGDMFYIKHGSDNFTIIDCNLVEDKKEDIIDELSMQKKKKESHDSFQHIQIKIIY